MLEAIEPAAIDLSRFPQTAADREPAVAVEIVVRVGDAALTAATITAADFEGLAEVAGGRATADAIRALLSSVRGRGVQLRRGTRPAPAAAPKRRFVAHKARRPAAEPKPTPEPKVHREPSPASRGGRALALLRRGPVTLADLLAQAGCPNEGDARATITYLKTRYAIAITSIAPGTWALRQEDNQ
jgi:hypothetical protein